VKPVDPRLVREAAPARRFLAATVVGSLLAAALVLAQALLVAHGVAHASAGWAVLRRTLIVLAVVIAGRALLSYVVEVAAVRAAAAVRTQLRQRLLAALARNGAPADRGAVVMTATRGLDALDGYFARYLPQLVLAVVVPCAVLVVVARADLLSAVLIGVTLPLIPLFMILVGLHTRARTERQWHTLAHLGGHFLDVVQGLSTLVVFRRAGAQAEVIREVSESHRRATMSTLRIAFLSALVLELLATLATALVAVEVGLRLLSGHLPYETALVVLLLAPEAYLPLRAVGAQFHASMDGATAAAHALDVIEAGPVGGAAETTRVDAASATIELRGVTMTYADRDGDALSGVDLTIHPGDHLAVVGHSGAGKSTLLSLLLGLRRPTAGEIRVDGVAFDALDLDHWRRQLAWVPQQPHLFTGTITHNIRLGDAAACDLDVERAAMLAGLTLPLDTPVTENGRSLSSGQRQRVALARAFLRDAPVLLLDEPTAHLDELSAADIRDRLRMLMTGRTVIVVSHLHGWDGDADRVVRLDRGRMLSPVPA